MSAALQQQQKKPNTNHTCSNTQTRGVSKWRVLFGVVCGCAATLRTVSNGGWHRRIHRESEELDPSSTGPWETPGTTRQPVTGPSPHASPALASTHTTTQTRADQNDGGHNAHHSVPTPAARPISSCAACNTNLRGVAIQQHQANIVQGLQ